MKLLHLLVPLVWASAPLATQASAPPRDLHGLQVPLSGAFDNGIGASASQERTIYQTLKSQKRFSRLVKAIELNDDVVARLDDHDADITFFAVPNSGLPSERPDVDEDYAYGPTNLNGYDLGRLIVNAEDLNKAPCSFENDKRKQSLARIVRRILEYNIIPEKLVAHDLTKNSTYATNLTLSDGSLDYKPLRISVQSDNIPPRLRLNKVVDIVRRDVMATNGVIHFVNLPVLPPPSIFQEAFLVPLIFSYATTAVQRVDLTGALDRWYTKDAGEGKGNFMGAAATTAFVPTSAAFQILPKKLQLYLFSPFGEKALKKILQYHIVPNTVFHSDYFHEQNVKQKAAPPQMTFDFTEPMFEQLAMVPYDVVDDSDAGAELFRPRLPRPVYSYNATLPTLLKGKEIYVEVARYKTKSSIPGPSYHFTKFYVNGKLVVTYDIPARNGALHVIDTLLDPRAGEGQAASENSWDDWEEWLPQWALEA
ncbi:FAS1 domain-containing protein [Coniophora puteana RWD-64-598 SS2]|uniref:FAS1 domain-containing protein n=1 Tax=Coniophora puteana (strain RWD-64-598) TaxID=741705 RepID=A0A5M3N3A5_CONPW|nr:FAS1 domain-containing protein [Coniophora puteana RWD-64-598 SS2]EIW85335.1 FAS1 domain-containing protein [Coniophora puteana RWD-64-598 SS2]